ncbi:MAG: GAF domain-containing protein [Candidatus Latescibacteria bacterium]|nr:GAF domain-containing protein [Candidatus Latescibacterota bacterium]
MERIRRAVWQMRTSADFPVVLEVLREQVHLLGLRYGALGINVIDPENEATSQRYVARFLPGRDEPWERLVVTEAPIVGGPVPIAWKTNTVLYRPDLHAEDPYRERSWADRHPIQPVRCVVDVPFSHGTLAINSPTPQVFSAADLQILTEIAAILSEGFRRLDDLKTLERQGREATVLAESISAVARIGDPEQVLQVVVEQASLLMQCQEVRLLMYDPEEGLLVPRAQVGYRWEACRHLRSAPGRGLSGQVFTTGKAQFVNEFPPPDFPPSSSAMIDALKEAQLVEHPPEVSARAASVPLVLAGKVVGVLTVSGTPRRLTQSDLDLLSHLGEQASVALERAAYLAQLEAHVVTQQRLAAELSASEAKYRSLFVAMSQGFALNEMIFDEAGTPVDYLTLEVNPAFAQILGVDPKAVVGQPASAFLPPAELERWVKLFGQVVREARATHYEQPSPANQKHFHGYAYALDQRRFAVLFEDASERKRAEERLQRSELQLKKAQRLARVGSWAWYIQEDRLEWSDEMYRLFGIEKEGFSGLLSEVVARAIHPDDRAAVERANELVATQKTATPMEYRVVWPDQTVHTVWAETGALTLDEFGNPEVLTGVVQDITERKKTERETQVSLSLQRLRNRILLMARQQDWGRVTAAFFDEIRTLVPCYRSSVQLIDAHTGTYTAYFTDGEVVTYSPAVGIPPSLQRTMASGRAYYRRTREELVAAGDHVPPEVACIVDVPFLGGTVAMSSLQEGAFGEEEIRLLERYAQALSEGYRRLEDLTRLNQAEQQLARAQRLESLGQLTAGVAHNFNNLVQAVVANLSLAAMKGPPQIQRYLEEADAAAMRGGELVRQLMLFTRAEAKEATRESVDLGAVVRDAVSLARKTIDRRIELILDLPDELPLVQADAAQLEQVLMNLILNARDALEGVERAQPWIRINASRVCLPQADEGPAGNYLQVAVSDNGVGMDARTRERIFEPFFTTKEVGKGTGLGLATAYGILQRHGGWIECESQPGVGTRFALYLPPATAAGEAPAAAEPEPAPAGAETLLLIDDDDWVRWGTGELLSNLGYRVLEAENGQRGLELARQHRDQLSLVLLDLSMPGLPGQEVLRCLRLEHPRLKVMLFTGYAPDSTQLEGAVEIVGKPFAFANLARVVRKVLDAPAIGN